MAVATCKCVVQHNAMSYFHACVLYYGHIQTGASYILILVCKAVTWYMHAWYVSMNIAIASYCNLTDKAI